MRRAFTIKRAVNRREMTMSPICLINVADIRDHAVPSNTTRKIRWYVRFSDWFGRSLRVRTR
jgi:hypothetical protein